MDEREKKILDAFLRFIREADPETKERMLYFCEGAVVMSEAKAQEEHNEILQGV